MIHSRLCLTLSLFLFFFRLTALEPPVKKVTVIGTGYVGLVLGAVLSEYGHEVLCGDIDSYKIESLNRCQIPIYEPGLEDLIRKNLRNGKLSFTSNLKAAIQSSDILFICVGTPTSDQGKTDTHAVETVAKDIGTYLNGYKLICIKSTVPIGMGKKIEAIIQETSHDAYPFDVASNPEFLREGSALNDCYHPERTVIGVASERAKQHLLELYWPLVRSDTPFFFTKNLETAEAIKYASNAFLAMKISFINEMANLCDAVGADVIEVAKGMGMDRRIGSDFLNAGPGFGGSCFPKDTLALAQCARESNLPFHLIQAVLKVNNGQREVTFEKLKKLCNFSFDKKIITVLGLSFKANTDDIRYSPAIDLIEKILREGGHVKAYDPQAMKNMHSLFPQVTYTSSIAEAVKDSDALVILTDWNQFKSLDLDVLEKLMNKKVILDARNILNPQLLKQKGWSYSNFGRMN